MFRDILKILSTPSRITAASFVVLIVIITGFFMLPVSSADGEGIGLIDAVFVATSAVCVVGLTPIDISKDLSVFGQIVVMVAMQIGALGLMTFTTVFYAALGRRMPLTNRFFLQESFHHSPTGQLKELLLYIVGFTFITEFIGAFLYFVYWSITGRFGSVGETIWHSVFMAITAFTNGGFSLYSDSIVGFQNDNFVMLVTAFLILAGGIGFLVSFELKNFVARMARRKTGERGIKLSIHTKITLLASLVITIIGTAVIFVAERTGAFGDMGTIDALFNAFFYTVTPRSGGLQSVEMMSLHGSSTFLIMVLMFIGAGAGSTGGGIKAGTLGIIFAYMYAKLKGDHELNLWSRTIPKESIDKAIGVSAVVGFFVVATSLVLIFSETHHLSVEASRARFGRVIFEAISAACTVGLSLDFTSELTNFGKVFISIIMLVGRLSPIGLAIAITARQTTPRYRYSEENIIVG